MHNSGASCGEIVNVYLKSGLQMKLVMPGLVPGIHVFGCKKDVDGRNKSGHDDCFVWPAPFDRHFAWRSGLTFADTDAISTPPGTSGLLAFEQEST